MQRLDLYRQLELISSDQEPLIYFNPRQTRWQRLAKSAEKRWGRVVKFILGNADPVIEEFTRNGDRGFKLYDPTTQKSYYFDSESELRFWFDRRYSE